MTRGLPLFALALCLFLVGVFGWWLFRDQPKKQVAVGPTFEKVDVSSLPGWKGDDLAGFRDALAISCVHWPKRRNALAPALTKACADLPDESDKLKNWLKANWTAWRVGDEAGRLTGYFEPVYAGARQQSVDFATPLYRVPDDLVSARLSDFDPDLGRGIIRGRLQGKKLVPYDDRKAIREGALRGRGLELLWLADPVDAFFLHIQGSGRITLPDGEIAYVGYASQNGHAYRAIGRDLIASGAVPRAKMSMQAIRDWLAANPDKADAMMDRNPSYIFFTERDQAGAIGAEGVVLTPERSIAVDRRLWYFGLPFWIDAGDGLQRLAMGQDTGGAIRGAVRADLFLGPGDAAGVQAGKMNQPLNMWLLLPKGLAPGTALR